MHQTQETQIAFIEKFVSFCHKNNIGYSIDLHTLLKGYCNQRMISHEHPFEVMMTLISYLRLKRLAPNNVLDSFIDQKFKTLTSAFVPNNRNGKKVGPFIQIRLIVPTTIKKVKKFNNPLYYLVHKVRRFDANLNNAINFLNSPKNEGFIGLDRRFKKIDHNGSSIIDFTTTFLPFDHFEVAALKNGKTILKTWFGNDGQNKRQKVTYLSPLQKINVKQKGADAS